MAWVQKELQIPETGPIPDGVLLRARRNQLGLTAKQVGIAIGVGQSFISQVETGIKDAGNILERASVILQIKPEELRSVGRNEIVELAKPVRKRPYLRKLKRDQERSVTNPSTVERDFLPIKLNFNSPYGRISLVVLNADVLEGKEAFDRWAQDLREGSR